jgi:hypothetical protein
VIADDYGNVAGSRQPCTTSETCAGSMVRSGRSIGRAFTGGDPWMAAVPPGLGKAQSKAVRAGIEEAETDRILGQN